MSSTPSGYQFGVLIGRKPLKVQYVINSPVTYGVLADGVGFEPTVPFRARRFSRPVP
jgi:hypothetical protein